MARTTSSTLTRGELRLMRILWDRGRATVSDVVEALPRRERLAYNTVLTTLRILERKGYLRRDTRDRAHVYEAVVDRSAARRSAVRDLVDQFFDSSPELLVQNIIAGEHIDEDELKRLRKMIAEAEKG